MKFYLNKKASVPEVILVLGVIAIFGLLLFSFIKTIGNMKDGFAEVSFLEYVHFTTEKFSFYKNVLQITKSDSSEFLATPIKTDANGEFLDFNFEIINAKTNPIPSDNGRITQIKFYIG